MRSSAINTPHRVSTKLMIGSYNDGADDQIDATYAFVRRLTE